ncbi:hypothetical protein C9374_010743 [Naegleria lovaniensis]|uniref:Uncharacterized protein n=1 Tax=Naegleria lovaniensis TaxID=51637 RepID=A0AA88GH26_NAELO|nr:uncharacterized protein C9374_010743 [Naegleria lovaniensis]KAG2374459.1 hypothetical protein C9374_010743 [Naegleria lovaniensis]
MRKLFRKEKKVQRTAKIDKIHSFDLMKQQQLLFQEMIVKDTSNWSYSDHRENRNVTATSVHSKLFYHELAQSPFSPTNICSLDVDTTNSGETIMGFITQVMTRPNERTLFVITDCGLLYQAQVQGAKHSKFDIVAPFDGSSSLKAVKLACYTEAMLLIAHDSSKDQYYIYGLGHNGYYRMSHFRTTGFVCTNFELMLDPFTQLNVKPECPPKINHVACCYSFSLCVINGHDVHITGQNWMNYPTDKLVAGYHCWQYLAQSFEKKVVKMEYGDFHVVLLHEDCSISVGGSNSSSQLTNPSFSDLPFVTLNLNDYAFNNIFSGSNSVLWVKNVTDGKQELYFTGSCNVQLTSYLGFDKNDKMKRVLEMHHNCAEFAHNVTILDAQYTRDFMLIRYSESPHMLFVVGSTYYGGHVYNAQSIDLRTAIPADKYSRGGSIDNFYRDVVKIRILNVGYVAYCDFAAYANQKMAALLLKSTDYSEPNNHLLLDISVVCQDMNYV